MKFVSFQEHNDHEGETWRFWLQLTDNETEIQQLASWLGTFDDNSQCYELDLTPIDEKDVDVLVQHSSSGYMSYDNKVTGKFKCPEFTGNGDDLDAGWDFLNDNFYKGDIERHFK